MMVSGNVYLLLLFHIKIFETAELNNLTQLDLLDRAIKSSALILTHLSCYLVEQATFSSAKN